MLKDIPLQLFFMDQIVWLLLEIVQMFLEKLTLSVEEKISSSCFNGWNISGPNVKLSSI